MGRCHSELNGLFYCIAFVCIDPRVLTVARCNRHKVRFLSISCFPVDLQHVMAKRKPAFSTYLEVGTFFCKTAFATPPKVDHLRSTNESIVKNVQKPQIFTEGAISTARATRRSPSGMTYVSPCISLHIRVCRLLIGSLVTEILAREAIRAERFFAFFTNFAPRF